MPEVGEIFLDRFGLVAGEASAHLLLHIAEHKHSLPFNLFNSPETAPLNFVNFVVSAGLNETRDSVKRFIFKLRCHVPIALNFSQIAWSFI